MKQWGRARALIIIGLLSGPAWGQAFPVADLAFDYSYSRYTPSLYSQAYNLNGGGTSITFNVNRYFGLEVDLHGFGRYPLQVHIPANTAFSKGASGIVNTKLWTYMLGPQVKVRFHTVQPFGHILIGGANTHAYKDMFPMFCNPTGACSFSTTPGSNALATDFGLGVDVRVNNVVTFRPAEVNYFLTRFNNPFTNHGQQHNVRYAVGVVFTLDRYIY